jgi:putative ATP-binding cassette transporter
MEGLVNLLTLLKTQGKNPLRRLVLSSAVTAVSTTVVLAVVMKAAQEIAETKQEFVDLPLAGLFIVSVLIYAVSESWMISHLVTDIEEAIDGLRIKLVNRLRHADLWQLEHLGQSQLFDNITQSCRVISSNSQYLAQAMRSVIQIATILLYIASISMVSFLIIVPLLIIGIAGYHKLGHSLAQRQETLVAHESKLFECVSDLFDGFQEQRLNSARSRTLSETFAAQSTDTATARNDVHLHGWGQFVFGETVFNLILGAVVFLVPIYAPTVSTELIKISAAVLFLSAPLGGIIQSLAIMRPAESAAGRMMSLEAELATLAEPGSVGEPEPVPVDFAEILMNDVEFSYPAPTDERPFCVGPLDVSIRRGETIFVTGGNGSGKSTLIKLLTGLYHPQRGYLTCDGTEITAPRLAGYRALMAPVFSDFHLFTQLYGLDDIDRITVEDLLRWMEMEQVSGFEKNHFTRTDLSTGQRKRLALIGALLETKPILILDEWAADQDAHFRRKFYRTLLPELKQRGLTIIAVTHDDHYFDAADRRLHIDEGRLSELPITRGVA